MRIAFIDAYHTGSHAAFSKGWAARSVHNISVVAFPGRHWKWRMRHSAYSAARALDAMETPDLIVATDMCNAGELRGHLARRLRDVPLALYIHEHQLTYPNRIEAHERDDHFALTNLFGALAADEVWCNSRFTLETMVGGLRTLLRRMPTPRLVETLDTIPAKARVLPPGVDDALFDSARSPTGRHPSLVGAPIRLLWNARWEHDKGPETIGAALRALVRDGVGFTCDLVGPSTDAERAPMERLRDELGKRVHRFGMLERDEYVRALAEADVVLSAAHHEFFGIGVVEAVASGALPVVPDNLAYPEVLRDVRATRFWSGDASACAREVRGVCEKMEKSGCVWADAPRGGRDALRALAWSARAAELDHAASRIGSSN